ncbi:hypothetical protein D3C87_1736700 [compost metagenome]
MAHHAIRITGHDAQKGQPAHQRGRRKQIEDTACARDRGAGQEPAGDAQQPDPGGNRRQRTK